MTNQEAYSWLIQPGLKATLYHYDDQTNEALRTAVEALAEVIRCGDCKWWLKQRTRPRCSKYGFFTDRDWYCAGAERR